MEVFVIKGKSPAQMLERFLNRNGWERCEIGGWVLPGKYLVKNLQEAFECQQVIARRKMVVGPIKSDYDRFLESLAR